MDPWFKFYASDYLLDAGVDSLPLEAQAILVRLWCLVWRDQFLKDDPDTLARRAVVDVRAMRKHWPALRSFFIETPDGLVSDRMEKERTESRATSESRRLGAQKTNEKRWGKRVAEVSPTDRSAIAQRPIERIAEVSLSESESDTEITTPLPPKGGRRRREPKPEPVDSLGQPIPVELVESVGQIVESCPREDRDGRKIRVTRGDVLTRLMEIQKTHPAVTLGILVQAWTDYIASQPAHIKAPQYFFGKAEDQGPNAANWLPYARAVYVRMQLSQEIPA